LNIYTDFGIALNTKRKLNLFPESTVWMGLS